MSNFVKYQKVRRLGEIECNGILDGLCYIFPKLDGANASVWFDGEKMCYGSRNRELGGENGLKGFVEYMQTKENITEFCKDHPNYRLFGEWLIPHNLKTYEDTAWRQFYPFDMMNPEGRYLNYSIMAVVLLGYGIGIVKPLDIINNPTMEQISEVANNNKYLIKEGLGEGVVVKNYGYESKFGHQTWGKLVISEFLESKGKKRKLCDIQGKVEETIIDKYLTIALIEKTKAKIENKNGGWSSSCIGEFIGRVWYDLIDECMFDILKTLKNPTINFKVLNKMTVARIKQVKPELF